MPIQLEHRYKETVSNLMVLGFFQVFIWGALLAVVAPVLVGPVTRLWTRLVPTRSPAWLIARATVAALETMGVAKGRLSPDGYGSQHPVASNDTEAGRAQNSRIAVRVTEK